MLKSYLKLLFFLILTGTTASRHCPFKSIAQSMITMGSYIPLASTSSSSSCHQINNTLKKYTNNIMVLVTQHNRYSNLILFKKRFTFLFLFKYWCKFELEKFILGVCFLFFWDFCFCGLVGHMHLYC